MGRALFLANRAREQGDVPVGAVVVDGAGNIIGKGWNQRVSENDPTAHAEVVALREAGKHVGSWNLNGCSLVVTLEPCTMCAGALLNARIETLVFAAWDEKAGAAGSLRDVVRDSRLNHQVNVIPGVLELEAKVQLTAFFEEKRSFSSPLQECPARTRHQYRSSPGECVGSNISDDAPILTNPIPQGLKRSDLLPEGVILR